jgi:S-DNA-T family DNA segregation ATPase FtsK/SpoIIIE
VSSTSVARVFIGDVDNWQAKWSLLARLRPHAIFVFDDCSPGEVRAVRRSRDLLPHSRRGGVICLTPNGEATRVTLTC